MRLWYIRLLEELFINYSQCFWADDAKLFASSCPNKEQDFHWGYWGQPNKKKKKKKFFETFKPCTHGDTGCASLKPSIITHLMGSYELRSEVPLCPGNKDLHLKTLKLPLVLNTGGGGFNYLTSLLYLSAEVVQWDMKWSQLWVWVPWKGLVQHKIVFHVSKWVGLFPA